MTAIVYRYILRFLHSYPFIYIMFTSCLDTFDLNINQVSHVWMCIIGNWMWYTLPKTNSSPLKTGGFQVRNLQEATLFEVQAVSFRGGYIVGGLPSLLFASICAAGFVSHREREEVWFCSVGRILKVWMVSRDRGEWMEDIRNDVRFINPT